MVKLSSNPTCVLSDADVITNEQAERIAKVLTKHLPGANNVTEAGKILGVNAEGDVALVEDKTGSTYTAGTGLTLENGEFSVDNPMPGASGASQGDVLTVGSNGPEWAAPSSGGGGGESYTAGNGINISDENVISVDNPMPGASGASQGDVLTVGSNGPEWAAPSSGGGDSSVVITGTPATGDGIRRADAANESFGVCTVYGMPFGYAFPRSDTGIVSTTWNLQHLHGIQFYGMYNGLNVKITNGGENPEIELVLAYRDNISKYAVYNSTLQDCLFLRSQGIMDANYGVYGKYVKVTSMADDPTAWTFYGGADVSTFETGGYIYLGYRGKTSTVENTPAGSANIPGVANKNSTAYIAWAANAEKDNDGLVALMPNIPPFTGADAGKVLAVDMYGSGLEWKSLT